MTENLFLAAEGESLKNVVDSLDQVFGMSLFEEEIDQVIFRTNEFLISGGADTGGPCESCSRLLKRYKI